LLLTPYETRDQYSSLNVSKKYLWIRQAAKTSVYTYAVALERRDCRR
jgi:hypothetical protein